MDELANLIVQGVAFIISFVAFATVKSKGISICLLLNTLVCAVVFFINYFSNFVGC